MADGEQARAGGADSLDERRSHACASGKSCWKCVVHATKAVKSRRFTVRFGDGSRPRPTCALLSWTLAPRQWRMRTTANKRRLQKFPRHRNYLDYSYLSGLQEVGSMRRAGTLRTVAAMVSAGDPAKSQLDGKQRDRKSTRLNSSHANISYAVFCLKKKKKLHATKTLTLKRQHCQTTAAMPR